MQGDCDRWMFKLLLGWAERGGSDATIFPNTCYITFLSACVHFLRKINKVAAGSSGCHPTLKAFEA